MSTLRILEWKCKVSEVKRLLENFNSSFEQTEEIISEIEDRLIEII